MLNEEEIGLLRGDLMSFLRSKGISCNPCQAPGQPLALDLLRGCLPVSGDVDTILPQLMAEGVSAGVVVWNPVDTPEWPIMRKPMVLK